MRIQRALSMLTAFLLLAGSLTAAAEPERHAGMVIAVDPQAQTLVVEELAEGGKTQDLHVRVTNDARLVFSERVAGREVADFGAAFRDRPIGLGDIRPGDFVVVEATGVGQTLVASAITVTLREPLK